MRTHSDGPTISLGRLLRPHVASLTIAIVAVMVEGGASLAEPWPLKLVLDTVLKAKPAGRWLHRVVAVAGGTDKIGMLKFAAVVVLVIAAVGAVSSYTERYLTTTVGYDVLHDLRQILYSHVQRLSLAYHQCSRSLGHGWTVQCDDRATVFQEGWEVAARGDHIPDTAS